MDDAFVQSALPLKLREVTEHAYKSQSPKNRKLLEPILRALDGANHKTALKLTTKALEKCPKELNTLLKLLKALALMCLGKKTQVLEVMRPLSLLPIKEHTSLLYWITAFLKDDNFANELFDSATQSLSQGDPMPNELFKALIARHDYKRLQQLCLRLHKLHPQGSTFIYDALAAMLLQIINSPLNPSNPILLELVSRSISQNLTPGKINNASEYWIQAKALEAHSRYSKDLIASRQSFLQFLKQDSSREWANRDLGFEIWRRESIVEFGSTADHTSLVEEMVESIKGGDTNWHAIQTASRAIENIAKTDKTKAGELLFQIQTVLRDHCQDDRLKRERGYSLGLLYFHCQTTDLSIQIAENGTELEDLIGSYFDNFGSKACFFDDILPYLGRLSINQGLSLVDGLKANKEMCEQTFSGVLSRSNLEKIRIFYRYRAPCTIQELREFQRQYLETYFVTLPLGKDLPLTDLQPADEFALLAAEAFLRAWKLTGEQTELLQAASLLHFALDKSPYRNQIRASLLRTYRLLGLPSSALEVFKAFNIRTIQYETLAHFIVERASSFVLSHPEYLQFLESISFHHYINHVDTLTLTHKVWSMVVLPKVEEYHELISTLDSSFAKYSLSIEKSKAILLASPQNVAMDSGCLDNLDLKDMRDVSILPDSIYHLTEMGPQMGKSWIQVQGAIYTLVCKPELAGSAEEYLKVLNYSELTPIERGSVELVISVHYKCDNTSGSPTFEEVATFYTQHVDALQRMLSLDWQWFHQVTVLLETLIILHTFKVRMAEQQNKNCIKIAKALGSAVIAAKSDLLAYCSQAANTQQVETNGILHKSLMLEDYPEVDFPDRKAKAIKEQATLKSTTFTNVQQLLKRIV